MHDSVRSQGRLVIGVNASSLFSDRGHIISATRRETFRGIKERLRRVRISSFTLRHSFQVISQALLAVPGATSRTSESDR